MRRFLHAVPLTASILAVSAFSSCGSQKPLPNLPPPEYEPGRALDLTPKAPGSSAPVAPPPPPG